MQRITDSQSLSIGIVLSLSILFASAVDAYAKTAADPLQQAQQQYSAAKFVAAVASCDLVLKHSPANAVAHYLKGNCLVKLNRLTEAINEYGVAEKLTPNSMVASYCRSAKASIAAVNLKSKSNEKAKEATPSDTDPDSEDSTQAEKQTLAGSANAKVPAGTLETIRKQATLAHRRALEMGKAEADGERSWSENAANSMREKAERALSQPKGSNEAVSVSPEEAAAIRARASADGDRLRAIGKWRASIAEQESKEKADEIDQQAQNLQERLLDERKSPYTSVKLNPVGTNLYIRNYAKPAEKPMHVKSIMATLDSTMTAAELKEKSRKELLVNGTASRNGKSDTAATKSKEGFIASTPHGRGSTSSVKGEVLPRANEK